MPRISNALIRHARSIDKLLPPLLRPCRELRAAQNELRWLREHARKIASTRNVKVQDTLLRNLILERASGKPLQYILGTEYFGELEIRCSPGVLIPRQDTAASVAHLARLVRQAEELPPELRVLDLCTGTGCVPLLFHDELAASRTDVISRYTGVDISRKAVQLAYSNLQRVQRQKAYRDTSATDFIHADVLVDPFDDQNGDVPSLKAAMNFYRKPRHWDILISNPPYISPSGYWHSTTRSVRHFEPKLALVPSSNSSAENIERGDAFYPRLLSIAQDVEAKVVLVEVADLEQAQRVARMALETGYFDGIEIWRDQPDQPNDSEPVELDGFSVIGQGNGRSVLCWQGLGAAWLGKDVVAKSETELLNHYSLQPTFIWPPSKL